MSHRCASGVSRLFGALRLGSRRGERAAHSARERIAQAVRSAIEPLEPRVLMTTVPDDPLLPDQWHLFNFGQLSIDEDGALTFRIVDRDGEEHYILTLEPEGAPEE